MVRKLNEVIAVEKEAGGRAKSKITGLHHLKADQFAGIIREYQPVDDDGEQLTPETRLVQKSVPDVVRQFQDALSRWMDLCAERDQANCTAKANVVVGGETLLNDVPVTQLLFLEKQLRDPIRAFIEKIPVLPADQKWEKDEAAGLWKTQAVKKRRTQKDEQAQVVVEPTEHHPGQYHVFTKDVLVGHWHETRLSGAIPQEERQRMLDRVDALSVAVKQARERANLHEAPNVSTGTSVLNFIFDK